MLLHADRSLRVAVHTRREAWVQSPEPGVERIPLERIGDEIARATSLVRYAAGSHFASHEHGRGEEIFVLEGELRDEHGVYPAGTYLRNPWGTRHTPRAPTGCTLFVKLRQLPEDDRLRVRVEGASRRCRLDSGENEREVVLHEHARERVSLVRWRSGWSPPVRVCPDGEELLVLEGDLEDQHGTYDVGTWIRQPAGSRQHAHTHAGCLLFVKRGPS